MLRSGGKFFGSFFLIENGVASADRGFVFKYQLQEAALSVDATHPERAVAYRLEWLLNLFREFDFELVTPVLAKLLEVSRTAGRLGAAADLGHR